MNSEQIERAATTMMAAAEMMQRTFSWWQQENERMHQLNEEHIQRFEAAVDRMKS